MIMFEALMTESACRPFTSSTTSPEELLLISEADADLIEMKASGMSAR